MPFASGNGGGYPLNRPLFIPAGAFYPSTDNGCSLLTRAEVDDSNDRSIHVIDFSGTSDEYAEAVYRMPDNYDGGKVTYRVMWTVTDTGASDTGDDVVAWTLAGYAAGDDDAISGAWGTAITVEDTITAISDVQVTSESGDVTIAGSPEAGDLVWFRLSRQASTDTDDVVAEDARVLGVEVLYKTDGSEP